MDRNWGGREAALRGRAETVIAEALAAAGSRAPSLGGIVVDAMDAVTLVCWDETLPPRDRLLLINDSLPLLATLKSLARAPQDSRPALIAEVLKKTNDLLRRHAFLVRAGAHRQPE